MKSSLKHYVVQEVESEVRIPYKQLLTLCGIPKKAVILSVKGDEENGLTISYSR